MGPGLGGCLRILRSADEQDVHAELPPRLGSASLIVRSESSWHSVPRVRAGAAGQRLERRRDLAASGYGQPVLDGRAGRLGALPR